MKEKRECKIVQDLFPSYIEKLTDEQTNEFIEEHLKTCESCKEKLEYMKNDIDLDLPKQEKKEVKFLKKYNIKLKTIQYIVLAVLLAFVFVIGRRYIILTILENKARNTINENNYSIKSISCTLRPKNLDNDIIFIASDMLVEEEYYKDGTKLSRNASYMYSPNGEQLLNSSVDITYRSDTKSISLPDNAIKKSDKDSFSNSTKFASVSLPTGKNDINPHIAPYTESFPERVSDALMYSIKKDDFFGNYYKVKIGNYDYYIDAETGLLMSIRNNDYHYLISYRYSFGTVTDEDVKEPDLSEYVVLDMRDI